jgi:hypothetical protein
MRHTCARLIAISVIAVAILTASGCATRPVQVPVTPSPAPAAVESSSGAVAATATPAVIALAKRNGLTIAGAPESSETTLALYSAPDNPGGLLESLMRDSKEAGYDLRPHLGERALVSAYPLRELYGNKHRQTLVVIQQGGRIIGVWIGVPDLIGGVVGLKRGR